MLSKYNITRLYSTGAYDYIVEHNNDRYLDTLTYSDDSIVELIIVNKLIDTDDTIVSANERNRLFESLKEDLTKRGIEFKINGNIINIEK